MGEKDIRLKVYLSDEDRYADLWNGSMFQDREVVKPQELEEISPVLDLAEICTVDGGKSGACGLRDAGADYAAGGNGIWRANQAKEKGKCQEWTETGRGIFVQSKKGDKIYPVSTLVVYWGKEEWDGSRSLHDMIDWGEDGEEVKNLVPEYPIHFLDLSKIEHPEYFKTELRPFFELYKNRNNKKEFIEYLRNSKECSKMDAESWDVLGKVTNSPKMINQFKNKVEANGAEEGGNVYRALQEFYDDGIAEGKASDIIAVFRYRQEGQKWNLYRIGDFVLQ